VADPVLGLRLRKCAQVTNAVEGRTAEEIFGHTDAVKLRSSMTLFSQAAADTGVFDAVLGQYFAGQLDALTLELLRGRDS
jgi:uncharacterized protein (DUF1810 family)